MDRPDWAPEGIDISRPSAARVYDYWLGGTHNFAIDREIARAVTAAVPETARIMQANRAFLHRAVEFLIEQGVRQFLDLGPGSRRWATCMRWRRRRRPTPGWSTWTLIPSPSHTVGISLPTMLMPPSIHRDLRDVEGLLGDPVVRGLLDFDQPVAVLMMAVLHFVPDSDDPAGIISRFRDALSRGSYLVLSHGTQDALSPEAKKVGDEMFTRTSTPFVGRDRDTVGKFFSGFDLVEPGLVWSVQWRPEHPDEVGDSPERSAAYVGVGRKQ